MVYVTYISIPVIGAIIGWVTNVLAIKLLFRPHNPIKLPLFNYSLQGLIPRRKAEIAKSIGEVVEQELISIDDLFLLFRTSQFIDKSVEILAPILKKTIINKLPHLLPNSIKDLLASLIADVLIKELPGLLERYSSQISSEIKKNLSFADIVQDKINDMDWTSLEEIVLSITSKELHHIEILGGVLGFFIGIVQLIIGLSLKTF